MKKCDKCRRKFLQIYVFSGRVPCFYRCFITYFHSFPALIPPLLWAERDAMQLLLFSMMRHMKVVRQWRPSAGETFVSIVLPCCLIDVDGASIELTIKRCLLPIFI